MTSIQITNMLEQKDILGITDVFYAAWLKTYPNKMYGILKEDVEETYKDRSLQEYKEKQKEHFANLPENQRFFIAKKDDLVVGVMRIVLLEKYNWLHSMYIYPNFQRQGIGHLLWQRTLLEFDRSKNVLVRVAEYNEQAISFYKKIGFIENGKRLENEKYRMPVSKNIIPEIEMIFTFE